MHGTTGAVDTAGPATSLGYSGEHFDAKAQQQYLRARFYNPANGRFNRLDPFAGNMQDPQSLHKYAYVHGDPIQGVDPSGQIGSFSISGMLNTIHVAVSVGVSYSIPVIYAGFQAAGAVTALYAITALIQQVTLGRVTEETKAGLDVGLYTLALMTIVGSILVTYPASPVRISDPGGTRWAARQIHQTNPSATGRRQTTIAVAQVNHYGVRKYYAAGSGARMTPAQRDKAVELGIPRENLFWRAQHRSGDRLQNHAERVIERNIPAGAYVERWGISWSERSDVPGQSWMFPCPRCVDTVIESGGKLEGEAIGALWAK